tara:strand:+ start:204 stop:557 length:354 start_codon:yes stop_codon:yes gene_type:complete
MNEEQLALETLKALGAKDTSSPSQTKRGTTCFTLPTGRCISEHKTGYIRVNLLNKNGSIYTCYQLNPQYKTPYKMIWQDGELHEGTHNRRMLIYNRAERLKRLVLYAIKDINEANGK